MASRVRDKLLIKETRRGDLERTAELLRSGCDVNKLASDGNTPLMRAAYYGHLELVELLLREGADPNKAANDGASALFWACRCGHEAIARLLLDAGADVNAERESGIPGDDGVGPSVLNVAISHAPASLVEALVKAGASLDRRYMDRDPVEYATWCNRLDLVPRLKPRARRAASK
jgi:ankyrin repeat protein